MYETIEKFFADYNAYITIIGLVLGILGIVLAFVFYFKALKTKKASFFVRSFNLLNDRISALERLEVFYDGSKIQRLTATKIAFWNSGDITIDKNDITTIEPIKICAAEPDTQIYDIDIISQSDISNNFLIVAQEDGSFHLIFDYLDKNQGCVIKILHTGLKSSNIKFVGKLKGVGAIEKKENIGTSSIEYRIKGRTVMSKKLFAITIRVGWILYLVVAFYFIYLAITNNWFYILGAAFAIFGCYVLYPKKVVPKNLHSIFSSE